MADENKSGQTTRNIDRWVQEFFTNGETFIYEGRGTEDFKTLTHKAFEKFTKRMFSEHPFSDFRFEKGLFDGIYCYKIIAFS